MMDHESLISIIIPCYNVQDTIEYTVGSVLNQTNQQYEIILINDGSTDDTLSVITRLQEKSDKIKVVDKANGGVSSARNVGIAMASSSYIFFLDGDDYIEPAFIEKFLSLPVYADVTIFGSRQELSADRCRIHDVFGSDNYLHDFLDGKLYIHISSFIVSKKLLVKNEILFDEETYYAEDREFVVKCLKYSHSFSVIKKVLFHYKWRASSAMHTPVYTDKRYTSVLAMERVYKFLSADKELRGLALVQLQMTILLNFRQYIQFHSVSTMLWDKLCANMNYLKMNSGIYSNRYAVFVQSMRLLLSIHPKVLFAFLHRF